MTQMQRRKFLSTVAGATATAPLIAKAKTKTRGDLPPIPQVALGNTGKYAATANPSIQRNRRRQARQVCGDGKSRHSHK